MWDEYQETLRMSTYLLAFVVSDFVNRKSEVGISLFARKTNHPKNLFSRLRMVLSFESGHARYNFT